MREIAETLFHGEEKYNCAQAILAAFQPTYGHDTALVHEFKALGGGRADGNVCGALHAALHIETNPMAQAKIREEFETAAGAIQCKTIRQLGQLPCKACVGTIANLLTIHGKQH